MSKTVLLLDENDATKQSVEKMGWPIKLPLDKGELDKTIEKSAIQIEFEKVNTIQVKLK